MKALILLIFSFFFTQISLASSCPGSADKQWLLGQVGEPSRFFTPVKEACDSETLNVFTNCIETDNEIFFGHITRSEPLAQSQCPYGYAPRVANGFFGYQKYNDQKVCLDPCHSISVGKFFRDEQKFGSRKVLNIGDVVYVPELKGKSCGDKKDKKLDGCAIVSQFIEYTDDPVIDFYSGTCKNIFKGRCLDRKQEDSMPKQVRLYKLSPEAAKNYLKSHSFPKVSNDSLDLVRTPAKEKSSF